MDLIKATDVRGRLMEYMNSGGPRRYYLGHKDLNNFYGIREASRTDWSGYPGSGKTELLIECLWNCSQYYDHKHLIHMPDAGSQAEIIAKLFHKITGKRMEKYYWTPEGRQHTYNQASKQEMDKYLPQILEYFKIVKPSTAPTPTEFWEFAEKQQSELKIFSAVIDSWNYMKHDTEGEREDKWLAKTLQVANDIVERSGMHFHTIIHPRTARIVNGKFQPPTFHELKGGSEWGNYAKSVIIVHRDKASKESEIHIEKVKGANIGIKGMCLMNYDISTGRYYTQDMLEGNIILNYAAPEGEDNPELIQSSIKPESSDFYSTEKEDDNELPF